MEFVHSAINGVGHSELLNMCECSDLVQKGYCTKIEAGLLFPVQP